MIIEDDPMVRHVNAKFLKKLPDFSLVKIASNLTEAKDNILSSKIQLILLDIFLPRENGIDFLKWLRKEEIDVDVILITADKSSETIQDAFRYGAMDYLIKPFTFERFKEALLQYKVRQQNFKSTEFIEQDELDKYIFGSKTSEGDSPSELEKGLNKYTYKMIWDVFIQSENNSYTAEELAETLGIARVTVRRYLEYLDREGKLDLFIEYGKVGRPQHKYRLKSPLDEA
jgi:response regulator of citrate/malate metabolism